MAMQGIKMIASAEEPAIAAGSSSVPVRDDDVSDGGVVDPPPTSEGDGRDHEAAVLGDDLGDEYYFSTDDEDDDTDDDDFGSDSEFEEDDEVPTKVIKNDAVVATAERRFLGKYAKMATVQSTVCFMSLDTFSAPPCSLCQRHHGGGEIIVDYTYTRFLRTQIGGDGVDIHMFGPKQARLRFVLPSPLTSVSSSLRFAGAVLASLVYPVRFSAQLQTLWSASVTTVPELPARTTCLLVTVNVGILRPDDYTPARMRRMYAALESMARQRAALRATPVLDIIAAELHLPALLRSEDDVRPTKRRRVTGEDCPICFELLEEGLAAWPRCLHIFHGWCLEQHLLRGHQECPLCRSELKLSPAPMQPCRK